MWWDFAIMIVATIALVKAVFHELHGACNVTYNAEKMGATVAAGVFCMNIAAAVSLGFVIYWLW
jgi:hypothetical protein